MNATLYAPDGNVNALAITAQIQEIHDQHFPNETLIIAYEENLVWWKYPYRVHIYTNGNRITVFPWSK